MKAVNRKSGFAVTSVLILTSVIAIISGSILDMAHSSVRSARRWQQSDQCLLAAQSGIDAAKIGMNDKFREYYMDRLRSGQSIDWFDMIDWFEETESFPTTTIGPSDYEYNLPQDIEIYGSSVSVSIHDVEDDDGSDYIQKRVLMVSSAECANTTRTVNEVITLGFEMTRIFDYAYFINNFGWFWGNTITVNGDVRANGSVNLRYSPTLNGDVYAAVNPNIPGSGDVEGSWNSQSRSGYSANAPLGSRPMSPANSGSTNQIPWPMGYNENVDEHPFNNTLEMPYLGDLSAYEKFAEYYDGQVQRKKEANGNARETLIDNIYAGNGPDGVDDTPDDGTLVLIGTENQPIEIDGPVVVRGDLVIKGYITGQGCIYAGRNIHVIDSVIYSDPPTWSKPDDNPFQTATLNADKDLVGFACKGNVIIGDYTTRTWCNNILRYIRPNFTAGYATDASDFGLGYDSDGNPDNGYWFDGNYTAYDGGFKTGSRGGKEWRRYYESSLSDGYIHSIAAQSVETMHGIYYNNHLVSGFGGSTRWNGNGFSYLGCMVARDEGIFFRNGLEMNWDIRLGSRSNEMLDNFFYFPQTLAMPHTVRWWESP